MRQVPYEQRLFVREPRLVRRLGDTGETPEDRVEAVAGLLAEGVVARGQERLEITLCPVGLLPDEPESPGADRPCLVLPELSQPVPEGAVEVDEERRERVRQFFRGSLGGCIREDSPAASGEGAADSRAGVGAGMRTGSGADFASGFASGGAICSGSFTAATTASTTVGSASRGPGTNFT